MPAHHVAVIGWTEHWRRGKNDATLPIVINNLAEIITNIWLSHQGSSRYFRRDALAPPKEGLFRFFEQGKVEEMTSLSVSLLEIFWNVKFWPGSLD